MRRALLLLTAAIFAAGPVLASVREEKLFKILTEGYGLPTEVARCSIAADKAMLKDKSYDRFGWEQQSKSAWRSIKADGLFSETSEVRIDRLVYLTGQARTRSSEWKDGQVICGLKDGKVVGFDLAVPPAY